MSWSVSTISLIVLGGAVVSLAVGVAVWQKRPDPMVWPLTMLMFAAAAWAIPHGISLGYTDIERVAFFHQLRYPGTVLAPIAYLLVAVNYAGYERWLSRRVYAILVIIPTITVAMVWTNQYHGLFWRSLSVVVVDGASVLVPEFGPWYWINIGYLYLITGAGLILLGDVVIRSGQAYRKQAGLMFVGAAVPLAMNILRNFGVGSRPVVDFTTTGLTFSGIVFALALFHFDLLKVRPVARNRLIEDLDDGMVVIDPNDNVKDFNPTASYIFEDLSIGEPADEQFLTEFTADGVEITAETPNGRRVFRTRSTALTDGRNQEIGRIVYFNDVTEIVRREQRLSILNRILRHNIRNELTVVKGNLRMLRERTGSGDREYIETAEQSSDRIIAFAEKARDIERTFQNTETTETVRVARLIGRAVENTTQAHANAKIDCECGDSITDETTVRVVDSQLFEMAITELLQNAIQHSDRERPQVSVRVEADGEERVRVRVIDDGPGIPKLETDVVGSKTETQLEHSRGLGLWMVQWTATLSSGELAFEQRTPRGTVVTLTLPVG